MERVLISWFMLLTLLIASINLTTSSNPQTSNFKNQNAKTLKKGNGIDGALFYGDPTQGYFGYPYPGSLFGFPRGIFRFPRGPFGFPRGSRGFPGGFGRFPSGYGAYPVGYGGGPGSYGGGGGGPGGKLGGRGYSGHGGKDDVKGK